MLSKLLDQCTTRSLQPTYMQGIIFIHKCRPTQINSFQGSTSFSNIQHKHSLVMWCLLQNTEATALTAKRQTDFALRQLDSKQHGEQRTARYPAFASFVKQFKRHIISVVSHILFLTSLPLYALTQSSIANRLNSQMVHLPCCN